jgi:hypothetical protein
MPAVSEKCGWKVGCFWNAKTIFWFLRAYQGTQAKSSVTFRTILIQENEAKK